MPSPKTSARQKAEIPLSDEAAQPLLPPHLDPYGLNPAWTALMQSLLSDPEALAKKQIEFWNDWMALWHESAKRFFGGPAVDMYEPDKGDRRFNAPAWQQSAFFDFVKQSYILTSRKLMDTVRSAQGLDDATRKKLDFYTRQFVDAVAPTNFPLTNPDVLQATIDSKGENLRRGFENLMEDIERGKGELKISTTNYKAFTLGENIATTKGKVVYQNELMQLIQYEATTDKVQKTPLLIVPPWINKFYILDLRPENSLIGWLVGQGHTVFAVSWVNPDRKLAQKRFEDYMDEGILSALDQIKKATGEDSCNVIGYCLGGTLLAVTLSYLEAHGQADRVNAATFLTTLTDFEDAGDMKLFLDDEQLKLLDREMAEKGVLEGKTLQRTFSLLRANDMIWSFVVNNYLLGKEPFPFDILYWNDDATNMPAAMHSFYLRKFYRDNLLVKAGGVRMHGTPIDLSKIKTPAYFLSTREDHIAPWTSTYRGTQLFGGETTFTLAASGHVAGVVNPPVKKKYCHWTANKTPADPQKWLDSAKQNEGSWWTHWNTWIAGYSNGKPVPARKIGGGKLKPIEDAPGSYVKMTAT
jgi:polyhydroxyalkanoate synthase